MPDHSSPHRDPAAPAAGSSSHPTPAEEDFARSYPGYGDPAALADLRAREYGRLDRSGHAYLDYTGAGLYADGQIERLAKLMVHGVYGNPHSHNPTSTAATALVERARADVHRYFNADPEEYEVIFTGNASGALRLVGEAYPFAPGGAYLLSYDNHNSVNGIREFARAKGAAVVYVPVRYPDLRLDGDLVREHLACPDVTGPRLFAYPAQSNFSGVQHPLDWIEVAHEYGWDVVLDAAAFVPTNRLDLSAVHPDFVPISFYKMFGFPTGIGALIARRSALAKLSRPWFAGGTITLASVQGEGWHRLAPGAAGFEDGTVDYLGLPGISIGLEHLEAVGRGQIHDRVMALTEYLLTEMGRARHSNGAPLYQVFGPTTTDGRGATVAYYLLDDAGRVFDVYDVETLAGEKNISVRTGCFCNPGDGEVAHQITRADMEGCFAKPAPVTLHDCQELIEDSTGKVPNTIRASFGVASNYEDARRLLEFGAHFVDRAAKSGVAKP